MAEHSTIEWTDATWNVITGCSVLSPGCKNCYAMRLAGTRLRNHPSRAGLTIDTDAGPVWNGKVRFNAEWLEQPLRWRRPRQIFVCAHGDLFHEAVEERHIADVFGIMAAAPWHTFQVLTKRSARARELLNSSAFVDNVEECAALYAHTELQWPLPNVIMMVSAERQKEADERIPDLLATPATLRGVSLEPLLGGIWLGKWLRPSCSLHGASFAADGRCDACGGRGLWELGNPHDQSLGKGTMLPALDWVIVGGESGHQARPSHPDWFRSLRDQCAAAGVPFHFKQWGEWWEVDSEGRDDETGDHRVLDVPSIKASEWFDPKTDCLIATAGRVFASLDELPDDTRCRHMTRLGKKAAGRLLDGVEHNGLPK
jgi:protein gp37